MTNKIELILLRKLPVNAMDNSTLLTYCALICGEYLSNLIRHHEAYYPALQRLVDNKVDIRAAIVADPEGSDLDVVLAALDLTIRDAEAILGVYSSIDIEDYISQTNAYVALQREQKH